MLSHAGGPDFEADAHPGADCHHGRHARCRVPESPIGYVTYNFFGAVDARGGVFGGSPGAGGGRRPEPGRVPTAEVIAIVSNDVHAPMLEAAAATGGRGEATTLTGGLVVSAFLAGIGECTYQRQAARLEQILVERQPFRRDQPSPAMPAWVTPTTDLAHRSIVLAQVWGSAGWIREAIREWIDGLVGEAERMDVASALALLARGDYDEVDALFLDPWSRGGVGWPGTVTAAYVLWCLSREKTTAPLGLQTALRWADSADTNQRATAMMAFSGELGVAYPTEAARRLWQLATRSGDLCVRGIAALGRLFAVLVDQAGDAGVVLAALEAELARCDPAEGSERTHRIAVEAVLAVLMAQSHRTARPAVAHLLDSEPSWTDVVARLWACVLRSRSAGADGLLALWGTVRALRRINGNLLLVRELGRALSGALCDAERARLRAELAGLASEERHAGGTPPVEELAAFLEAMACPPAGGSPPAP